MSLPYMEQDSVVRVGGGFVAPAAGRPFDHLENMVASAEQMTNSSGDGCGPPIGGAGESLCLGASTRRDSVRVRQFASRRTLSTIGVYIVHGENSTSEDTSVRGKC